MGALGDPINALYALLGILATAGAWARWLRPRVHARRIRARARDVAILGREAIVDPANPSKVLSEAVPALGVRLGKIEEALVTLAKDKAERELLIGQVKDHEARIVALEQARVERLVSQAESAHMWRAIGEVGDVEPEQPPADDVDEAGDFTD